MADFPAFPTPEPQPQPTATLDEPTAPVRVRFAPSPTGPLHVGHARTALFNWLFARAEEGRFILRMEDTDPERSALEVETHIMEDLAWLGLEWDEGPDRGGPAGPYRQGERLAIYRAQAETLVADGSAYPCFCTEARLAGDREEAKRDHLPYRYRGHCRNLDPREAERRRATAEPHAIRFRTPAGTVHVQDRLRGLITFTNSDFGDFVLVRGNGIAAYNFAVVVDDALMGITHVIRGDDHLPNTPRQALLFDALAFPRPEFIHLPPVLAHDGRRLNRNDRPITLAGLRAAGIQPAALVSYLATLGWAHDRDRSSMDLDQLIQEFVPDRLCHHPAHHDEARLHYFQRRHLQDLPAEALARLALPYLTEAGLVAEPVTPEDRTRLATIVAALHGEIQDLPTVAEQLAYLFRAPVPEESVALLRTPAGALAPVDALATAVVSIPELTAETAATMLREVRQTSGVDGRRFFLPIRAALTGRDRGPELDTVILLLGRDEACRRLHAFAAVLRGG